MLILNIILAIITPALTIWTILLQKRGSKIPKYLVEFNIILLLTALILNPYNLVADHIDTLLNAEDRNELKQELINTEEQLNNYLFTIRNLDINLDIVSFNINQPDFGKFTLVGKRFIHLVDTANISYPLSQDSFTDIPNFNNKNDKRFFSSGNFKLINDSKLKGKNISELNKLSILKIAIDDFTVGDIKDTIGIKITIDLNGINYYKMPTKFGMFAKVGLTNNDTIFLNVNEIFDNSKNKVDSIFQTLQEIN